MIGPQDEGDHGHAGGGCCGSRGFLLAGDRFGVVQQHRRGLPGGLTTSKGSKQLIDTASVFFASSAGRTAEKNTSKVAGFLPGAPHTILPVSSSDDQCQVFLAVAPGDLVDTDATPPAQPAGVSRTRHAAISFGGQGRSLITGTVQVEAPTLPETHRVKPYAI